MQKAAAKGLLLLMGLVFLYARPVSFERFCSEPL